MRKTLILSQKDICKLIGIKEALAAVERAFKLYGQGKAQMPSKIYIHLGKYGGDFRAMPSYVAGLDRAAVKWVNVHPRNSRFGLPAVMAIIILSDPRTGFPLCVMDGTYATNLRTGAAGGVAAKYLARPDSRSVGLVGSGSQAATQLLALNELFDIKDVNVWGYRGKCARQFLRRMKGFGIPIRITGSVRECVRDRDIVVTTTPSRKPLVRLEWLRRGCHINAIGADAKGKQELGISVLKNAKVVVDSWEQASHSGEINVGVSKGAISKKDIYADIGEIVSGAKRGRSDREEITVFDSTGLAIQDTAVADVIYRKAVKSGAGKFVEII